MKENVTESRFINQMMSLRPDNFSREALVALFDYLGEIERESDTEIEFDPISICCEWSEHKSAKDAASEYGETFEEEDAALDWILFRTQAIQFDNGLVIMDF